MKSPSKIILAGLLPLSVVCSTASFSQVNTGVDQVETQKWREDLRYMSDEMRMWHRNLFHTVTRARFDSTIDRLYQQIPSLARYQIIVEMARIVAMIGDGHTNIAPTRDPKIGFRSYPLKLYFFSDGLYIRAATRDHADIVGSRVVSIGNASVEQAYDAVRRIIGCDNEMDARFFAPFLLTMPEVLHALGLISDMDAATYTLESHGHRQPITLKPFEPAELLAPDTDTSWTLSPGWVDARDNAQAPTPLWLNDPTNKFWFKYLSGSKTVYVQFNQVGSKEDETVEAFSKRLFSFVEKNPVDRLILDLRLNRGGNGQFNRPLLLGIIKCDKIDQKGKLFTIIGRGTWSAAQFLVNELEEYTNTLFVGEPTGGKVNSYGDSHRIVLPNSRISVRVSTLWWQEDERDTRHWTAPQIAADLTFEDYHTNTDPALNAILNYVPRKTLSELLTEALSSGGFTHAAITYREWRADPSNRYAYVENELNALGYQLLASRRTEDAIGIFKLNVSSYPSSNAFDSLGEAYMTGGQQELAVESYEKSLELNPKNANAREMLKKIQAK